MLSTVGEEERGDEEKGFGSVFLIPVKALLALTATSMDLRYLEKPIYDLPTYIVLVRREKARLEQFIRAAGDIILAL